MTMVAIPIPVPPVPLPWTGNKPEPLQIPTPGNPITFIGRGVKATWDDVFGWIKGSAAPAVEAIASVVSDELAKLIPAIEAYVGQALKATTSFINDVGAFATDGIDFLSDLAVTTVIATIGLMDQIYEWSIFAFSMYLDLYHNIIPELRALIAGALDGALDLIHAGMYDVMHWVLAEVMPTILEQVMSPVLEELLRLDETIRSDVFTLVAAVAGTLSDMIEQVDADLLARIAAFATVAVAAEEWIRRCGDPMCSSMGPLTDLGKLFKAFEAAGILALLMEVGNMTEADVEDRLRELAGKAQDIVGAFESTFVGGGGDLHDFALSLL